MRHGMTFNGTDLGTWLDCNPSRPIAPETEVYTIDIPGADGARFNTTRLRPLTIGVNVRLRPFEGGIAELRHLLAALLITDEPKPLTTPDDPTRYHLAILSGKSDLSVLWTTGKANLEFLAPDPVAYGQNREIVMTTSKTVHVGGTYRTSPIIEAHPAKGTYYRISLTNTGEYVQIDRAFSGTETVLIDCSKQQATVNGTNAKVTLASDYFTLTPGKNSLTANSGTAEVSWTERWL